MHLNSKLLFERYALAYFKNDMKVLEIGPDSFPSTYQSMAHSLGLTWHSLDIYQNDQLTYSNSSEYTFPIADEEYDIVVSAQVIEHVKKPWRWMPELARVTKVNGLVITVNPVSWTYHEAPVDCWRIYPEGMKSLYEEASLEVLLSRFESLEVPQFKRHQPGVSLDSQGYKKRLVSRLLGCFGFPVERSYDTITIGQKRTAG